MPWTATPRMCPRCASPIPDEAHALRLWCSSRCRNAYAEKKSRTDRDVALSLLRRLCTSLGSGDLADAHDTRLAAEVFLDAK